MITLQELEIKHCFELKHVILNFETNNQATTFTGCPALGAKLIYALQSFFCKDRLECKEGCTPECKHETSLIRIKFICRIWNGNCIVVDAARLFPQSNIILYYFDDKQYIDPFEVFRERCQLNVLLYSDHSMDVYLTLMQYCNADGKLAEMLTDYLSVSNRLHTSKHRRVTKYMHTISLIDKELDTSRKRVFIDVINEIGEIFKYITWDEYSVRFTIPLIDKTKNAQDMNWDIMDLSKTEAWVTKIGSNSSCILSELEPGLKEIMKISQIIALAKHLQQKCIFVDNITVLEKYQNQELNKEALKSTMPSSSEARSSNKNFIWRIVDICNKFEISIFINCIGRLPALPSRVNVVQCQSGETNTEESICVRVE